MNNTIDFKTAKTIDSMSKKLDHIDEDVYKRQISHRTKMPPLKKE